MTDATNLCAEIRADARREVEKIVREARQEAEAMLAKATAAAAQDRQARLDAARAEAKRQSELLLATVPVEVSRRRSACREALLQSIHDDAGRQLRARAGFDYRQALGALVMEAVSRMAGNEFVVKVAPADVVELAAKPRLSVMADPDITEGVVVADVEGRQVWDNRLTVRLDRLWPELRRQIAIQTGLIVERSGG